MKRCLLLAACLLPLLAGNAVGQTRLAPDPVPRLPPQPGQGLPIEDVRFLERATDQSMLQVELGQMAAERAANDELKRLGEQLAADHAQYREKLAELAEPHQVDVADRAPNEAWRSAIDRLQGQSGEDFDRAFLNLELGLGRQLVDLYQTQASHSTDKPLASFAITTLVRLKEHFETARRLGELYGLSIETVEQPPQY